MPRFLAVCAISLISAFPASAQVCGRGAGNPMEMQVHLSLEDPSAFNETVPGNSGADVSDNAGHRSGGISGQQPQDFSFNMIRVELQDSFGAKLQEYQPNSEGKVAFRVCSRVTYRLRVTGPEIEETAAEHIEPGRGDRIVNLAVHHKGDRQAKHKNTGTISTSRLKVPRNAEKELEKGNAALANGNLNDAQQSFSKAIELYPDFDQAYNNLGVILMQTGDVEGGKKAFEKAIEVNDHFARAYVNLAKIAVDTREFNKAYDLARKALSNEPLNPGALFVGAEAAYFSGLFNETIAYAKTLHSLPHENFGLAHFLSAKSLQAQNNSAAALVEYELFLKEDPTDPNAPIAQQAILQLHASLP